MRGKNDPVGLPSVTFSSRARDPRRSRATGAILLLVGALVVVATRVVLTWGVTGTPSAAPLPGAPAVGTCRPSPGNR